MKQTNKLQLVKRIVDEMDPATLWRFKHAIDHRIKHEPRMVVKP